MTSYLKELRANSKKSIESLSKQIENSEKTSYGDERFWKLTVDKSGNGEALIRFLPPMYGESVAWVEKYSHAYEGATGRWVVENCPTTIGQDCGICAANREIWKNNPEEIARKKTEKTKRIHKFYSNILVIDDPANPENNGKVFMYEYGPKIFAKIKEAIKPISSRQNPIDPFDIDEGANFLILAKNVAGQRNYDSCRFESVSAISDNDKEIEKILNSLYSLKAVVSPENFKSFEDLKNIYDIASGRNGTFVKREVETEVETADDLPVYEHSTKKTSKISDIDIDLDDLPF